MLIIPTYNERGNVMRLVSEVRCHASALPILFVDDNSPDGTGDEVAAICASDSGVSLLSRPAKLGLGSAYRDAFQRVLRGALAEFVITMDADLSHPPDRLPAMLRELRSADVVVGSRYVAGGSVQSWGAGRRWLSRFANGYATRLTGLPLHDATAGFVAYRVSALRRVDLTAIESDGYAFQIELKDRLHRAGCSIKEIPISFHERASGRSKIDWRILLEGARYPVRAAMRAHRWRAA
jgi:dolichol-phosphate mannosyltransferase